MLLAVELGVNWFSHILFEDPSWGILALAVALVVVRLIGRRKGNKKLLLASWLPLVLMVALWTSARLVETKGEKLVDAVEVFLLSVEDNDMATFRAAVSEDAETFYPPGARPPGITREDVIDRLRGIKVHDITLLDSVQAAMIGDNDAATVIRIRVDAEMGGFRGVQVMTWQIVWKYQGDRWQVMRLECAEVKIPLGGGA